MTKTQELLVDNISHKDNLRDNIVSRNNQKIMSIPAKYIKPVPPSFSSFREFIQVTDEKPRILTREKNNNNNSRETPRNHGR